jgi:tRNA(Leu) C34 or U34 (ribose-2'-O)-methylase TrmL
MTRGHVTIALHSPKTPWNIGGALRACSCYGASLIVVGGRRGEISVRHLATDTLKAWRHIPTLTVPDVFDAIPVGSVPIAVDLLPDARDLRTYRHPERAFYVFGPEDGTLGKAITDRCRDKVFVPTEFCMNLAATVNVVLYDRLAKS